MRWKPFPIVGGAYKDDARPWSAQDTLNYLVVMAERPGGRSPSLLRGVPGLRSMAIPQASPVRGLHNAEGLLCAVVGDTFYTIAGDGGVTAHGTIPGVSRVSMAHNQITGGNQIAIANGMSGYVYDTTTGELTHITDEGFPGSISFGFVDGYITAIEPGRRFAFFSQLADATSYNTLDRLEAESKPDRLVGQAISHREWWLFGERTIELYQNTGAATGTFQRAEGVAIEVGCASGHTIVNLDNSIFWLGNDGIVYRANGYTPERISTHAIEQDIARSDLSQAFAYVWSDRGHAVYYLTFPDGHTWGYDAASGEWHRRQSEDMDRWRINDVVRWNNQWIAGDFSNGRLYVMDWARQDENGAVLERRRTTGVLADSQNAVIVNGLELVIDTGQPGAQNLKLYGSLGALTVGEAVDFQYRTEGGSSPVALSILNGSLPDGLTMDSQGHVTGTPTMTGDYTWTVQAVDALGQVATLDDGAAVTGLPWVNVETAIDAAIADGKTGVDIYSTISQEAPDNLGHPYPLSRFKMIPGLSQENNRNTFGSFAQPDEGAQPRVGSLFYQRNNIAVAFFKGWSLDGQTKVFGQVGIYIAGSNSAQMPASNIEVTVFDVNNNKIGSTIFPYAVNIPYVYSTYGIVSPNLGDPPPESILDNMSLDQSYYVEVTAT